MFLSFLSSFFTCASFQVSHLCSYFLIPHVPVSRVSRFFPTFRVYFILSYLANWSDQYWQQERNRKMFFENFAHTKGFDPLEASRWYYTPRKDIYSAKVPPPPPLPPPLFSLTPPHIPSTPPFSSSSFPPLPFSFLSPLLFPLPPFLGFFPTLITFFWK